MKIGTKFKFLIIALVLFIPGIVNAEEFNFTMPDAVYQSSGNGVTSYAPTSGQWWSKNIYSLGSWITPFSNGDLSYNTNGIAVVYNTTSLCANSSGILTGSFYTNGSTSFFDGYTAFSVYLNSRQCSVYYNGYYLSFSCSVYNETSLNLSLNGANVQREAEVGIGLGQVGTLTCDVGNNDIIINNNQNTQDIINNQNQNQQQTNERLDEIIDTDISEEDKELPNDNSYQNYNSTEQELLDKTKDVDLDSLNVGLDVNSSNWVWDTLTSLIQSHSVVFGMFISILSIGIIKLALGR